MENNTFSDNNQAPKKNKHLLGLLAGIGIGFGVGCILAIINIAIGSELNILTILSLILVGFVVSIFVPNKSAMGAITGATACGLAYLSYALVLLILGYWYEDGDSSFWLTLIVAVVYGGIMGYKGRKGFKIDEE